jgi:hypothetical protein
MVSLVSCTNTSELVEKFRALIFAGRTSQGVSTLKITPSLSSSTRFKTAGIAISRGEFLMLSSSEWPNDAAVSFLSDTLQQGEDVQQRFYLTPTAARGILRRARTKGKPLPPQLEEALEELAAKDASTDGTSSPSESSPQTE